MYKKFFGLTDEPFRLTPDPRFLHLAEPHRQTLIALLQGIVQRRGFLLATGPVGTGKTTLLHALFLILGRNFTGERKIASALIVNPLLTRDEFLEYVLQELEISCPQPSKPRRLLALHQFLLDAQRRGSTTVIVIDEAHLLPLELMEEIRLLSNADSYREKLLQVVLCGQPELKQVMARPELRALNQRVATRTELRELSLSETRAYIAERLHIAGLRGPSPFPASVVDQIHVVSSGVPRVINLLCDSCLSIAFESKRRTVGEDILFEVAANINMAAETAPSAELEQLVNQVGLGSSRPASVEFGSRDINGKSRSEGSAAS